MIFSVTGEPFIRCSEGLFFNYIRSEFAVAVPGDAQIGHAAHNGACGE